MSTTVATPVTAPPTASSGVRRVKGPHNYLGGLFAWVWLAIIIIPIYYVVITTFKDQGAYFTQNPLALPNPPTLTAYRDVVAADIGRYFLNSVIVTVGAVIPLVLFSFLAAYAIVRGDSRLLRFSRTLFLLGLAIPLQATIVPIYLIITRIQMYDSLGALILPSIAFGIHSPC
jgi:raffinose/stachyose/melibiose transport system permease protein